MIWTDPDGRTFVRFADGQPWEVIDFTFVGARNERKRRVPFQSLNSSGRAFVPHGWDGETRVLIFGRIAYRETNDRLLASDFAEARPVTASAAERSWGRSVVATSDTPDQP